MKYLTDECLSPELATLARDHGHLESTHLSWLGLAGQPDRVITRRAIDDGYVLVTHNTVDFRPLYGREEIHVGLIALQIATVVLGRRCRPYARSRGKALAVLATCT